MPATYVNPLTDFGFNNTVYTKGLDELVTLQDKWLYTFRHLAEMSDVPSPFTEAVFRHLFAIAELARFDPKDRQSYEESLKYLRDLRNSEQTARLEGEQIGLEKGEHIGKQNNAREVAIRLFKLGTFELSQIAEIAGLTREEVEQLQQEQR